MRSQTSGISPCYRGGKILLGLAKWEGFPSREGISRMRCLKRDDEQIHLARIKGMAGDEQECRSQREEPRPV